MEKYGQNFFLWVRATWQVVNTRRKKFWRMEAKQ